MRSFACVFIFIFSLSANAASFEGCKGLEITKSRDFSTADVSVELKKAEKRINDICGKILPQKLGKIEENTKACVNGSTGEVGPGLASGMKQKAESQVLGLKQRIETACKAMKKTVTEADAYCSLRKSSLTQLEKGIAAQEKVPGEQAGSLKQTVDLYGSAVTIYEDSSKKAGEAKDRIYAQLPDKDERRGEYFRRGNESATTQDPKTDKIIGDSKSLLGAISNENKNKKACGQLIAKNGQLDEVGNILKNNLWPNGKVAARAIGRVESADKEKAGEFGSQKAAAQERLNASEVADASEKPSDISGTEKEEGPRKMTEEELSQLNRDAEASGRLQAEVVDICKKQGNCQSQAALKAALDEAKNNNVEYKGYVESSARRAVSSEIIPSPTKDDSVAGLNEALRDPASAVNVMPQPKVDICVDSYFSWWSLSWVEYVGTKQGDSCVQN